MGESGRRTAPPPTRISSTPAGCDGVGVARLQRQLDPTPRAGGARIAEQRASKRPRVLATFAVPISGFDPGGSTSGEVSLLSPPRIEALGVVLACQQVEHGDEIAAVGQAVTRLVERWGSLAGVVLVADAKHT